MRNQFCLVVSLLAVAGCALFDDDSDFPSTARSLEPPALYRTWWSIVEGCSDRARPFDEVSWFQVGFGELAIRGESAAGAWFVEGNRIVLKTWVVPTGALVRHEMLHAILQTGSHPPEYFERKCGDEVACGRDCQDEAPLPDARELAIEVFEVRVALYPPAPSIEEHKGFVTVALHVRNPANGDAYLSATRLAQSQCVLGFLIESTTAPAWSKLACTYFPYDERNSRTYFRAGETRRFLYDVDIRRPTYGGPLHAGAITVRAILADNMRHLLNATIQP